MKVLFILKTREVVLDGNPKNLSSGLLNSALMVSGALTSFDVKLVHVIDNNQIDLEVTLFKPDVVVIEALWVIPEKFEILTRLHPKVKWIIKCHSNIPFLAQEGMAIDWITRYVLTNNVYVAANTRACQRDLKMIVAGKGRNEHKIVYFPNYYSIIDTIKRNENKTGELHFGCFGAVRPLKNHLLQATAAINYGQKVGKSVFFHINASRVEGGGEPALRNLRACFEGSNGFLIEHEWLEHAEFLGVISKMDLSMQVSFSETFNIVTADAVTQGIPVVVSPDIFWVSSKFWADPVNTGSIVEGIEQALSASPNELNMNRINLQRYNKSSLEAISELLNSFSDK